VSDELREPRDANHIWLRQSVTFTVNGQTRTVEMALPLRPGATPGEVEALLDEADAGMRRLSRRLDAHLAELAAPDAASASARRSAASLTEQVGHLPEPQSTTPEAPRASMPSAAPRPAPQPAQRPAAAQPPAPVGSTASPTSGPELTIPQFIAQAAAIGFNQRQAMEKLGVRSLSGLNLREALESLRRQALLDGAAPAPNSAQSAPASAPPPASPLAFEEEDDSDAFASEPEMELSYPDLGDLPDDDAEDEEDLYEEESGAAPTAPAAPMPPAVTPDLNALRRDARLTPASKLPAPAQRRSGPLSQDTGIAETPAPPLTPAPPPEETPAQRAERMLAELRATPAGGVATKHQRDAFANIVVSELTEKGAAALTSAIWDTLPGKLGPEQLDALISWGKRDHFKDEAREVLRLAKKVGAQPSAPQEEPAAQEPPAPPARGPRSASRSRPTSQPDEPRGNH
jgi:hypothetical protein